MVRRRLTLLLTHKIMLLGAIGVVAVALLGAIYMIGVARQERHDQAADTAALALVEAKTLQAQLLEARRSEKDFLLRLDKAYADRHEKFTGLIKAGLAALNQRFPSDDQAQTRELIKRVETGFADYRRRFTDVVDARTRLGLTAEAGLDGALRASASAIEKALENFSEPKLQIGLLTMRRNETNFMLRRDMAYAEEMPLILAELMTALDISDIPASGKRDIGLRLAAYQRDFSAWVNTANQATNLQQAMSTTYASIEGDIDALFKTVADAQGSAQELSVETAARTQWLMKAVILASIIGVALFSVLLGRSVSKPVTAMADSMRRLATGDLNVEIAGLGRRDEIGDVANSVERFKVLAVEKARQEADAMMARQEEERERQQKLADAEAAAQAKVAAERMKAAEEQSRAVNALGEGLQRMSSGDLTYRLPTEFPEAYARIRDDFNMAIVQLKDTMTAIVSSTQEVSNASAEIAASTTDLSQRTEEQAASLEETSASMEEIAATVKKNAENAQAANRSANSASEVAGRGGQVVANAVDAMARIEESSRKISDIIGVIDEIARQTNLLALNAAVEAARAGEAGRGFAVVASEVRSLAQRSSQAAKDIKDLIVSSNGQVKDGVELVNKAGQSLSEIVDSIKSVASIVADIASASAEQAIGIAEVNKALTQMDEATQQNSALVEENAATAKTLETQAQAMNERVNGFTIDEQRTAAARSSIRRVA